MTAVAGQARNTSGAIAVLAATGYSANPAAVTTARGVDLLATLIGALVVKPFAIPEADWKYGAAAAGMIDTTDLPIKAAAGTGIRNYLTALQIQNVHATVASEFVIKDGATVILRLNLPAAMAQPVDASFPTPLRSTANAALSAACIITGVKVFVNAQSFAAP